MEKGKIEIDTRSGKEEGWERKENADGENEEVRIERVEATLYIPSSLPVHRRQVNQRRRAPSDRSRSRTFCAAPLLQSVLPIFKIADKRQRIRAKGGHLDKVLLFSKRRMKKAADLASVDVWGSRPGKSSLSLSL